MAASGTEQRARPLCGTPIPRERATIARAVADEPERERERRRRVARLEDARLDDTHPPTALRIQRAAPADDPESDADAGRVRGDRPRARPFLRRCSMSCSTPGATGWLARYARGAGRAPTSRIRDAG